MLPSATDQQAVKTATVQTEIFDGFEVLHTGNTAATVQLFTQLTAQIQVRPRLASEMHDFVSVL